MSLAENTLAVAMGFAMAAGIVVTVPLPRPKPEPPAPIERSPVEVVTEARDGRPATLRIEPVPEKTDAQRVEQIEKDLKAATTDQKRLAAQLKALAEEARRKQ